MEQNIIFAGKRAENKVIRLDLRQGHLSQYTGPDKPRREFDYAEGKLKGISVRPKETPNGEINFLDLHFDNSGTKFIISSIACSSVSADLVAHLATIKNPDSLIRVDVWPNGAYTNCAVKANGEKLSRLSLPKAVKVQNGLKSIIDSSDRDTAVLRLVDEINSRLGYASK